MIHNILIVTLCSGCLPTVLFTTEPSFTIRDYPGHPHTRPNPGNLLIVLLGLLLISGGMESTSGLDPRNPQKTAPNLILHHHSIVSAVQSPSTVCALAQSTPPESSELPSLSGDIVSLCKCLDRPSEMKISCWPGVLISDSVRPES
jgi:hypothetical protein